ncbi:hypothetical protein L208DRAFT_1456920 [Tricholoma matsutake]|nr:hypothetical protein L208DRAFT_1456920 [Tricholoma matsutake 945]
MAPKARRSTATKPPTSPVKTEKNDAKAMPPPPDPPVPHTILEPEVRALSTCLMVVLVFNAAVKTGQIYGFYADARRLGIQKYAPEPPRSLTISLGREVEKYDQLCDSIESRLLRAIAVLQRDLHREERHVLEAEKAAAAVASRTRSKSTSLSPTSIRIPLPAAPDSGIAASISANAPVPTPTNSPTPSSTVGPGRRPSAISISSLQRPTLPLKLDLSSTSLRISTDDASLFTSGLASPVTLAPRSARAVGPNEFPPGFMEAFASSASPLERPVDIDLTVSETSRPNSNDMKRSSNANVGSSADKPIELDLDSMDIDMAMTDLFGDSVDNPSLEATDAVDGLFSPVVGDTVMTNDFHGKSPKTEGGFLDALSHPSDDIFATLDHSDHPQQLKASSSVAQSALYQGFTKPSSSSQLVAKVPNSGDANEEAQFDLNSLDLSTLSPGFFGDAPESDMNFPMDMSDFLDLRGMHEQKEDNEGRP